MFNIFACLFGFFVFKYYFFPLFFKKKCESISNLNDRFKLMDENKKYKNQIESLNKETSSLFQ